MKRWWLAVVGEVEARDIERDGWRHLRLGASDEVPVKGDRIAILRVHRPHWARDARFIATVEMRSADGRAASVVHRFVAPAGYEPGTADIPRLHGTVGWTDERVAALLGTINALRPDDGARIEASLRERALAHGPRATRPAHARPRTPGRRRLISARIMARRPPAFR